MNSRLNGLAATKSASYHGMSVEQVVSPPGRLTAGRRRADGPFDTPSRCGMLEGRGRRSSAKAERSLGVDRPAKACADAENRGRSTGTTGSSSHTRTLAARRQTPA